MAQEIYHRSEWGNPNEQWGNVYLNADLTNELYKRASEYENSWVTDQLLNGVGTKPSIILTPTAYEDGLLNSVKPAKTFGSELVTNGTFDTDSDWTKATGWTISGGKANHDGLSAYKKLSQLITTEIGKKYQYKVSISNLSTHQVYIMARQNNEFGTYYFNNIRTENGNYTFYFTAVTTLTAIVLQNANNNIVSIDNVSVKEVTDADFDFTRGSSATRVNEKGLIQDVQILSDELVQNGNFEQIGSEQVTNGDFSNGSADWFNPDNAATFSNNSVTITGGSGNRRINQSNVTSPTSSQWKLQYEITEKVGTSDLKVYTTNSGSAAYEVVPSTIGVHTYFFNTNLTTFYFNFNNSTGSITIDNVSVKEVGQNWSFGGDNFSIVDGALRINRVTNTTYIQQNVLTSGRKYKVEFDVLDKVDNNGTFIVRLGSNNVYDVSTYEGTRFSKILTSSGTDFRIYSSSDNGVIYVDNISIIEITDDTDLPRINYTNFDYENGEVVPYSGEGSLLLEPQSTNLIPYSNLDFGTGSVPDGWVVGFGTGTYSHTPTTYQGQPAVIHRQETTGRSYLRVLFTGTNAEHTVRVKFDRSRCLNMENNDYILSTIGVTNFQTKSWADVDANGILEFQTTFGADANGELRVGLGAASNVDGDKTLVWSMPQMELGSYGTSYIPTEGSIKTRLQDICKNAGSSDLINSTEGVLYAEVSALANGGVDRSIALSDGTTSNYLRITLHANSNRIAFFSEKGVNYNNYDFSQSSDLKVAFQYKENDWKIYINGTLKGTDTSALTFSPNALSDLSFSLVNTSPFYGNVKCVAVFKEALSDEELQKLTTI